MNTGIKRVVVVEGSLSVGRSKDLRETRNSETDKSKEQTADHHRIGYDLVTCN